MNWITFEFTKPGTPVGDVVERFELPAEVPAMQAVDNLILEETCKCQACASRLHLRLLPAYCPICGALRDRDWWQRMLRLAQQNLSKPLEMAFREGEK
ncbi:MAG: hypothetical protein PHQ40_00500 [Anaerolineaceae bacterium]|nr:hypothetical protein [Anaerolineaceae bacterium]MDD5367536.1 hypothetical protein [Anaerolineaceae bacterium]